MTAIVVLFHFVGAFLFTLVAFLTQVTSDILPRYLFILDRFLLFKGVVYFCDVKAEFPAIQFVTRSFLNNHIRLI